MEALGRLRPVMKDGTVSAGNASSQNDAASVCLVVAADKLEELGLTAMGYLRGWAVTGCHPAYMGIGPVSAVSKVMGKIGMSLTDMDLIELNEAFAAQACAVNKDLGWDTDKVNVNGGAIAIGHPIGASGARILVTLLYEMQKREAKKGLATLCIGGGMGIAMCVERD